MIFSYRYSLVIGLSLAVIMTSLGCAQGLSGSRSQEGNRWPDPPTLPLPVFESQTLDRPYKVIGIISAKSGSFKREQIALYRLKARAYEMGGHALLDVRQGGVEVHGAEPEDMRTVGFHMYSAKVIVFLEEEEEN